MPRFQFDQIDTPEQIPHEIVEDLANELANEKQFGQPVIVEQHFKNSSVFRVTVVWDEFEGIADALRNNIIRQAYHLAEGPEVANNISLTIALTYPEAFSEQLFEFELTPTAPLEENQNLVDLMVGVGATTLFTNKVPRLLFRTEQEAIACHDVLKSRIPGQLWILKQAYTWTTTT